MPDEKKPLNEYFSPEEADRLRALLGASDSKTQEESGSKQDEEPDDYNAKATSKPKRAHRKFSIAETPRWLIVLVGVVVAVALAFGYVKFVDPVIAEKQAAAQLDVKLAKSPIVGQNTELLSYKPDAKAAGEIPTGVNPKQLGLGENGKLTSTSAFVFASDKATKKSHVMDVYMDFYSQRARDFITINKSTLAENIQTGDLILRIHPILNKDSFSIYAPEALAEVFGTAPKKAWGFFTNLMKDSITLTGQEKPDQILDFIAKTAQDNGGKQIDEASIGNATFLTWLYTASTDAKLKVGYTPPVIYVDDKELDQNKWTINDPEDMVEFFSSLD